MPEADPIAGACKCVCAFSARGEASISAWGSASAGSSRGLSHGHLGRGDTGHPAWCCERIVGSRALPITLTDWGADVASDERADGPLVLKWALLLLLQ